MDKNWRRLINEVGNGRRISTHSGEVHPGDVFVALSDDNTRRNTYIDQARQRGAAYIVAADFSGLKLAGQVTPVLHSNPAEALGELCRAHYDTANLDCTLIGVTGTNGKTTVVYLLDYLLHRAGYKSGMIGTINYSWPGHQEAAGLTTPDCLRLHQMISEMSKQGVQVISMEVSSHALFQNRIAGLDFQLAVFTNLSRDHLDYHGSLENYYQSKTRLFQKKNGQSPLAIVNLDDPFGRRLLQETDNVVAYGLLEDIPENLRYLQGKIEASSSRGLTLSMRYGQKTWQVSSPLVGRHNASNLLAAQLVALEMGLGVKELSTLQDFTGVPGRLQRVFNNKDLNIYIDYAHTPDALSNVLSSLRALSFKKLVVVFGCGGDRDKGKRPLMGKVVSDFADIAVLTSDNPRSEDPEQIVQDILPGLQGNQEVILEPDRKEAICRSLQLIDSQDALLIAGKGHENYQEIKGQRLDFSDLDTVKKLLDT